MNFEIESSAGSARSAGNHPRSAHAQGIGQGRAASQRSRSVPAPPLAASWKLYALPRVAVVIVPVVATVGGDVIATVVAFEFASSVSIAVIVTGVPSCLTVGVHLPAPERKIDTRPPHRFSLLVSFPWRYLDDGWRVFGTLAGEVNNSPARRPFGAYSCVLKD